MKAFTLGLWALFTICIIALGVALIGQNTEPLSVSLFNYTTEPYAKWLVLVACAALGCVFTSLFFLFELIVLQTRNVRLRRANKRLERALVAMKDPNSNGAAILDDDEDFKEPGVSRNAPVDEEDV